MLIGLLRHSERKVQLAVLGALRNLSFGRTNDTNKVTIAQDHGLLELIYQLRSSRSTEVRELVTGVLWNLSSCEVSEGRCLFWTMCTVAYVMLLSKV